VLELSLVVGLVLAFRAYQQRDAATGPAPSFEAQNLDGVPSSLGDLEGSPAIVHFWASWCGVCRAMEDNVRDDAIMGVPVVRIASRSGAGSDVRAYLEGRGEPSPHGEVSEVLLDEDGSIAQRFGVRAFPTTFFLDGDGRIRHVEVGYTTSIGLAARALLVGGGF
jgi:thiol-disulfide isomerase/thioredoxin